MNIESGMTRRTALGVGFGAVAAAVLAACGGDDDDASAASDGNDSSVSPVATSLAVSGTRVLDTLHGPVEIPADPQRIVCLSFVETACLLDIGVTPVGMNTSGVNFLPEYTSAMASIPEVVEAGGGEVDLERIAGLQPDLILGADWLDESKRRIPYAELSALAPTAICEWQQAAGNWPAQAEFFADAVGRADALAQVRAAYEVQAATISATHAAALAATSWALVQGGLDGSWYLYTPKSSHGQVLAAAGVRFAEALVTDPSAGFIEMSDERLGDLAAADVIAVNMNVSATAGSEAMQAQALFTGLPAAQAGHVFPMTWFFPSSYKVAQALLGELDAALQQLT